MTAITFDTLASAKRLKERGFSEQQAEAVIAELKASRDSDLNSLVTKADLRELEVKIDSKIESVKADLFKWLIPLLMGQAGLIAALVKLL
jgi:hypothetical protein